MTATSEKDRTLWRHRDFMLLWIGQSVADMGSAVTVLALPLVAILALDASTFEVGLLAAAGSIAFMIFALPAGAIVDRRRKRGLMVACDIGRALILATVPLVGAFGTLTMVHLYAVAFATGVLTLFFEVAYQSYLPAVLTRQQLVDGNGKLGATNALAAVAGPTVAGALVSVFGSAARAVAVNCVSFVASAVTLLMIRTVEEPVERPVRRTMRHDIAEGFGYVVRHPVLRRVVACTAISNLFNLMTMTVLVVFMARSLKAGPDTIGLVLGAGSAGGVVGGVVAGRLARWLGSARMLWLGKLALGGFTLLIPLAQPGAGVFLVAVGLFAASMIAVMFNVSSVSYRQAICPPTMLGRMNASVRWIIRGVTPLGSVLGGSLGIWIGLRETLLLSVVGSWAAVLLIVVSPLVRQRDIEVPVEARKAD